MHHHRIGESFSLPLLLRLVQMIYDLFMQDYYYDYLFVCTSILLYWCSFCRNVYRFTFLMLYAAVAPLLRIRNVLTCMVCSVHCVQMQHVGINEYSKSILANQLPTMRRRRKRKITGNLICLGNNQFPN